MPSCPANHKCPHCGVDLRLINAALELAKAQGHALSCRFAACTCGAVEKQKELLGEFWRLYRLAQNS